MTTIVLKYSAEILLAHWSTSRLSAVKSCVLCSDCSLDSLPSSSIFLPISEVSISLFGDVLIVSLSSSISSEVTSLRDSWPVSLYAVNSTDRLCQGRYLNALLNPLSCLVDYCKDC